jgi:hypothetical protein
MPSLRERDVFYNRLPEDLEEYVRSKEFLEPIETTLGVKVYYSNNQIDVEKCSQDKYNERFPSAIGCRGAYNPTDNTIWLVNDRWCRKTLIHEVLHAVSYFAHGRYTEVGRVKLLNEGITEFLTGYILYKNYEKCYNVWLNGYIDGCDDCPDLKGISCRYCKLSYEYEVKIIHILAECVGIREIIDLFVYKPNTDWKTVYQQFLDKHGIRDELFVGGKIEHRNFSERFKYAMIDAFELDEEDVDDILNSDIKEVIDYSKL